MGALHSNKEQVSVLWSTDPAIKRAIFAATMSRNRFNFILRFIRFDDVTTRQERNELDKLAPCREIFELFAKQCRSFFSPSSHLTVDEKPVPTRNRCPFRVYIKSKPHRYGIKLWVLADNSNGYCHNLQVYTGKRGKIAEKEQGRRVVNDLTEYLGSGYGVTTDNFFTSVELADDLLSRNLTFCGTVRKNKAFIPSNFLPNRSRAQYSSV